MTKGLRPRCLLCECSPELIRNESGDLIRSSYCTYHNKKINGLIMTRRQDQPWHGRECSFVDDVELPPTNDAIDPSSDFTGSASRKHNE